MCRYDDAYIDEKVKQDWGWVKKKALLKKKQKKNM